MSREHRLFVNLIIGLHGARAIGAERYTTALTEAVSQHYPVCYRRIGVRWDSQKLQLPVMYTLLPLTVWAQTRTASINHITHNTFAHLLHILPLAPCVVTCLDLIELEQLEAGEVAYSRQRQFHIQRAAAGLIKADRVVTLSEFNHTTLVSRYPELAGRVSVIYPGVDQTRYRPQPAWPETLARYGLRPDQRYVLYVGSEQKRKNLSALVAAVAAFRSTMPDVWLVKVGRAQDPAGRAGLLAEVKRGGLQDRFHLIEHVDEVDLPAIYNAASVFVFPSRREGFGLPPLEAMACGTPVISSNATSLPEVVGDAALLFDPDDVATLARQIVRVLDDRELAVRLSALGQARAQAFTYAAAATRLYCLYQQLASTAPGRETS